MEFDEYQELTEKTAEYPEGREGLYYLALGLNGEAGEIAEKVKKSVRDGKELEENVQKEMGDVLWYMARLLDELGFSLEETAEKNIDKLLDRKERGKIHGDGDNR